MLPGFRFLFAAIVLTVSLLIFGLGAAALLRASHERFASLPARPPQAAIFTRPADATPPTLAILRVEPLVEAPSPIIPPVDTLLPTDRLAALSSASRSEDIVAPPAAVEPTPEIEPTREAASMVAEPDVADAPPLPTPVERVAAEIVEPLPIEPARSDSEFFPQQVAALPEPEITGGTPSPVIAEPLLMNAKPIRRPPLPNGRPPDADVVAALPDPALAMPPTDILKSVVKKRKPVVKRVVVKKRRVVTRPQRPPATRPSPAAPFGAPGFGTSGFGASPFGT